MTFEEYALKNLDEMKSKEPTAQNMRDVALLELWLVLKEKERKILPEIRTLESTKGTKGILPAYFTYIETKRNYQLKESNKEKMLDSLKTLSEELKDLIKILYRNTDTIEERQILNTLISEINVGNI